MSQRTFMARGGPLAVVSLLIVALLVTACGSSVTVTPGKSTSAMPSTVASPVTAVATANCPPPGSATSLDGAGATFPAPLYTLWFDTLATSCNLRINYQPIGSGGGIKQHTTKTVDFGASDGILTEQQKKDAPGTLMIPMTAGAVAIVVNLQGVSAGALKLSPETLADIYLGKITKWNDAKIAADNAGLSLPSTGITVVRRADGSGTTNIFTTYLSQVSSEWKDKVGKGNSVQWPTGLGGEGNAGVAGQVKQIPGAVGYVELAYATQNKMAWASLKNQSGNFVQPSLAATTAAMEGIEIPDSTEVMITNSANADAYPISGLTWIIVYQDQANAAKAQTLASILWWGIHDGQKLASGLEYAPLSAKTVEKAEKLIKSMTVSGKPVLQ